MYRLEHKSSETLTIQREYHRHNTRSATRVIARSWRDGACHWFLDRLQEVARDAAVGALRLGRSVIVGLAEPPARRSATRPSSGVGVFWWLSRSYRGGTRLWNGHR